MEPSSRFTALFEALAIEWLRHASQKAVAEQLALSWDEIHGILERAVKRGLARRAAELLPAVGVDEKAFRKGHRYFTLVNDLGRRRVLYVAEERTQASPDGFWPTLTHAQRCSIRAVAMDMWDPYVNSTRLHLPDADSKIVFDKFHIAKHLGEAADKVRRRENKLLRAAGDDRLAGTRYDWLRHPAAMEPEDRKAFAELRNSGLKTARAWALKEAMMAFFGYVYERPARKHFRWWRNWALRSRLQPMVEVARTLTRRFENIVTYLPKGSRMQPVNHEREDSVGQVHRARLPEYTELHQRHLFPLRRTGPRTGATKMPEAPQMEVHRRSPPNSAMLTNFVRRATRNGQLSRSKLIHWATSFDVRP